MAEALETTLETAVENGKGDKKLQELFRDGWKLLDLLEGTSLPFNSSEFQVKTKEAMKLFETATVLVSNIGMFSPNELIDEVSTESLQYLLLPYFLGKLTLKINQTDRVEVLNVAEVYFKDYLQRCQEYDLCEAPKNDKPDDVDVKINSTEMEQILNAARARNDKIAQFRRKKELEEHIILMKNSVMNNSVDEEGSREFFLKFLKKSIIDATEELNSLTLEKQMAEMRKISQSTEHRSANAHHVGTGNAQSGIHRGKHDHHNLHHHHTTPKPKPLQPFIITRDATQKAVFGLGYPSLPVLTVGEFYEQRVQEGIFPNAQKVAEMNQAQVLASAQNENEKEDLENAVIEAQIEIEDPDYIARMRRMDDYKDVVRRGDGNRHNRS